ALPNMSQTKGYAQVWCTGQAVALRVIAYSGVGQAHLKVADSNPAPATIQINNLDFACRLQSGIRPDADKPTQPLQSNVGFRTGATPAPQGGETVGVHAGHHKWPFSARRGAA